MASASVRGAVLLLKAPRDMEEDPFVETLKEAGYQVVLVPVLSFHFVNQEVLASALRNADRYSGIIFTSVRAVHAVTSALATFKSAGAQFDPSLFHCFVVGQSTAKAAKEAHFEPQGADTGNAEKLAELIVDLVDKEDKRPLLYPCAQIRRDTLLDRLHNTDCSVEEVIAYETVPSESIKEDITSVFSGKDSPDSVVYFSPSGVQFTESLVEESVLPLHLLKVYALGPATEQALVSRHFPLVGVAIKPDPASLLQLLQRK